MIAIALSFLGKYWKLIAVALAVAAVYFYMHGLYSKIEDQQHKITELTTANTILKENNDKLEKTIVATNKTIDKLADGAKDTNKAFSTLNTTVKAQAGTLEERLRRIMQDKKPQTCEATIEYLLEAAKGFRQ